MIGHLQFKADMKTNALPPYDDSDNPTGCCPRFKPQGWDGARLHFKDKPFLRATTRSAMHVPLNTGRVFARVQKNIEDADAYDPNDFIVLSRDISPWKSEHPFSVSRPVRGEEETTLSSPAIALPPALAYMPGFMSF